MNIMMNTIQHCLPPSLGGHKRVTRIVSHDYISIRHHNKLCASEVRRSKSELTREKPSYSRASSREKSAVDRTENLLLSQDLLGARSELDWQSVRWSFVLDVFYYEMTLHSSGPMRIGLASDHVDLASRKLGSDPFSIAFDGCNACIWHDGISYQLVGVDLEECWNDGDVIGVKCDVAEKSVTFFVNGTPHRAPHVEASFFAVPYFPAASLYEDQQCAINFGKEPFRYSV